jgi:hypothetical protein
VVCQIDALQRLRPESNIIEAALANLPRTLDETYEGVFERIPEDSRLFVQHVLHWMSTHQSIHQAIPGVQRASSVNFSPIDIPNNPDIPCDLLFQVVQESLASENSDDAMLLSGYVLDEELLRELCGCLITVTNYPIRGPDFTKDMPVVSFAHYTVVEFLESRRIRGSLAAPFALDRKRVVIEHATVLLRRAVASANRWNSELPQRPGPDYYADFDRYCVQSTALLLHWQPRMLDSCEATSWMGPVVQLLETPVPQIGSYFWYNYRILHNLENPVAPAIRAFRQTFTLKMLSTAEPHLESLLRMVQVEARGYLAQTFLTTLGRTLGDLAHKIDVEFHPGEILRPRTASFPSHEDLDAHSLEPLRFRGSILEFSAQLLPESFTQVQPGQSLYEILDLATGHFDPSTVMLLAIPGHRHPSSYADPGTQCWGCLLLRKLLRLGAKSTVPGFAVGSLQIAAAFRDLESVTLLLEAGVDPNDVGDLCGDIGTPETGPMLEWFQCARGRSPLNMIKDRHLSIARELDLSPSTTEYDPARGKIETILVQYGAKDFVVSSDEDLTMATKLEMVIISEKETGVA